MLQSRSACHDVPCSRHLSRLVRHSGLELAFSLHPLRSRAHGVICVPSLYFRALGRSICLLPYISALGGTVQGAAEPQP